MVKDNSRINHCIDAWEKESQKIRNWIEEVESDLIILRGELSEIKHNTKSAGEYSVANLNDLTNGISNTNTIISRKNEESQLSFPMLKEKSKSSTESIGNIITHLQYHDIIRQKIEHVQKSHQTIVENLENQIKGDTSIEKPRVEPDKHNRQIADIVGLQAAQLIMVSKEYQNAIEVITNNFQSIANDIKDISALSTNFSYDDQNSEITLLRKIKDKLDEAIILLDQSDSNRIALRLKNSDSRIANILKKSYANVIDPLKTLGKTCLIHTNKPENENNLNSQLVRMISDILSKNENLEMKLNEISEISASLIDGFSHNELGSQIEQEKISLMVRVSKILRHLDVDNNMLDTVLSQNDKLNSEIISKIESTINKVEYYMLFEDVLKEVILNLNKINQKLKPEGAAEAGELSDLSELEKIYTVKSERIIHRNLTEGTEDVTDETEEEDDDLELF